MNERAGIGISVLIVDQHAFARRGYRALLALRTDHRLLADEASNAADALRLAHLVQPDIAIVDSDLPTPELETLTKTLVALGSTILIGTDGSGPPRYAGNHRIYFSKNSPACSFGALLDEVLEGKLSTGKRPERLSSRELEVARLLARGKSNKEAAFLLNLSVRTVETHRARIRQKLGVDSIGQLVRFFSGESDFDLPRQ